MSQNPYESPNSAGLVASAPEASVWVRACRVGGVLVLLGAPLFYWSLTYKLPKTHTPFWFQVTSLTAIAMLLFGLLTLGIAGPVWIVLRIVRKCREVSKLQRQDFN